MKSHRHRYALILSAIAGMYWLVLFAATHYPRQIPGLDTGHLDKVVHFSAYAVLAFVVAAACTARVGRLGWSALLALVLGLAIYGALDELTQALVNRSCSVYDWLADVAGATVGTLLFAVVARWWFARRQRLRQPTVAGEQGTLDNRPEVRQ
jgi:VanZ family protein